MRAVRNVLLVGFGFLFLANTAQAQTVTYTWTGAVSGDWNNAANWNPQTVPGTKEIYFARYRQRGFWRLGAYRRHRRARSEFGL